MHRNEAESLRAGGGRVKNTPLKLDYSTPFLPPPKLHLQNSTPFFLLPTVRDQLNVSSPIPHGLSQHGIALYETIGITC